MLHTITIKPYGESLKDDGDYIEDFDDEDMDLILELYKSLSSKCKKEFEVLKKVEVEREGKDMIVINYSIKKGKDIHEDDLLFYMESLIGLQSLNIISFGDEEYAIKGSPQVGSIKSKPDEFLAKIDAIAYDIGLDS